MSYTKWWEEHAKKHANVIAQLKELSDEEIIEYFSFSNMCQKQRDFCPLYEKKKQCHEMERLNCYFCACPFFRFKDDTKSKEGFGAKEGRVLRSYCAVDAKQGKTFVFEEEIHQDCSDCLLPHQRGFIKKHFSKNWKRVMAESLVK